MTIEERQKLCERIYERMLGVLLQFEPVQSVAVGDVKFIANYARTISFDEIEKFDRIAADR